MCLQVMGRAVLRADQKVENVPAVVRLRLVQLRIAAARAGNGDEFLVLNIENLGEIPAGGLKLIRFIRFAAAFLTYVLTLLRIVHLFSSH